MWKKTALVNFFLQSAKRKSPSAIFVSGFQLFLLSAVVQPEDEEDLWKEGESKGRWAFEAETQIKKFLKQKFSFFLKILSLSLLIFRLDS